MTQPDRASMVRRFPVPPAQVRNALATLQILRTGDPDAVADLGDLGDLPRPWDPATCPSELRRQIWQWCDQIADWVNHEYAWRPGSLIPGCWPQHPHLARELPVLACLHHSATDSSSPDQLEDWHRHSLPLFLDRLTSRLGESTCRTGRHQDWPAAGRYDAYNTVSAQRHAQFKRDTDTAHESDHGPGAGV